METIWILIRDSDPDPEAFQAFDHALSNYREHIDERSGLDWDSEEFEWHDYIYNENKSLRKLACYCYGEFIADLIEVEVKCMFGQ